jgi:flagellar motor switch protein FliM
MDIDLWLHSVRLLKRNELRALIPGVTFIAIVGLAPLSEKILLEVDLRFVYRVVDQLLGGNGIAIDIHRPLTEIEQGVFSYVVLKVLALFQEHVVSPDQVAIRLEDMRHDMRSVADIVRHEDHWVCASWKMNFDLDVGYIRVLAPASLARRVLSQPPPRDAPIMKRMHDRIRKRMARLSGVTVNASVEAGRIELSRADLEALDPGDIVLLDGSGIEIKNGALSGEAVMTIGLGRRGTLKGVVHSKGQPGMRREDQKVVFEVTKIDIAETPPEHDPVVHHGEPGNPEEVIAEYEDSRGSDQSNDGAQRSDDLYDEDWGIDDENAGEDEQYEDGEGEGEYGEKGYDDEDASEHPTGGHAGGRGGGPSRDNVPIDDSDNLAEAEPLLGDIPIAVVVELGRVQLTADEVIRLRAGQIIELGRSPADPVDLVVAGRLLAKGELVEIEGALGVKLLSLVKDS